MSVHTGMHIYTYSLYEILGKYKYIFYQAPLLLFIHKILFYDRDRSRSERSELKYSNFSYLLCFLSFLDLQFSSKAQIALRKVLRLQLHATVEVLPVTQSLPSNLLTLLIPLFLLPPNHPSLLFWPFLTSATPLCSFLTNPTFPRRFSLSHLFLNTTARHCMESFPVRKI